MFKVPKSINVGGYKFKVTYPHQFLERTELGGLCIPLQQEIFVTDTIDGCDERRSMQSVFEFLIHESVHAVDYVFLGGVLTEQEVVLIARGWHQVLRDNDITVYNSTEFKLPESLNVANSIFKIVYPYEYHEYEDIIGSLDPDRIIIYLVDKFHGVPLPKDVREENFIEIVNKAILYGYFEADHEFTDRLSYKVFGMGMYLLFKYNNFEKWAKQCGC